MGKVTVNTACREEEIQVLQEVITLIHSRYDWGDEIFYFESDYREDDRDRKSMKDLRTRWNWTLKPGGEIKPNADNLALCLEAARLIHRRYEWGEFRLNFPTELQGSGDKIVARLRVDFHRLYNFRHNRRIPKGVSANNRVFSTLEGLMFQAIRSVRPFSVKRTNDAQRFTRVLRCLEGLLYQLLITMGPDFKSSK